MPTTPSFRSAEAPRWAEAALTELAGDVDAALADPALAPFGAPLSLAASALRRRFAHEGLLKASVHLPRLVHEGLGGSAETARGVAVVTALLEMGIDLADHIADDELPGAWQGLPRVALQVTSALAVCALPQRAIERLDVDASTRAALHGALALAWAPMAAGQLLDFAPAREGSADVDRALRACEGKSGARRALYATLAAVAAGASTGEIDAVARFGRALGVARQLASDAGDLSGERPSRDLAAGVSTFPIAWLRARLGPEERGRLDALRAAARTEPEAAAAIVALAAARGAIARTMVEVALWQGRARSALAEAALDPAARAALSGMIDACRPAAEAEEAA